MSASNWRDKWRGKKIVTPEPKPMTAKNVHDLTIEQIRLWAGKALDYYLYLDAQSKKMELEEDRRTKAYQMGQAFIQCNHLILLFIERMAQRDKVIDQKDAEIQRLNEHVAELLNRPML